ncbi:MAG: hypothetical protein RQM92_12590 [Candidatus Syntrophopropionicum ammoniitolerans]
MLPVRSPASYDCRIMFMNFPPRPETKVIEEITVAIHGQGFPTRDVSEDLSQRYPAPLAGYFNIGLLHTCATGREGHGNYAPCDTGYLKNKGYDYWPWAMCTTGKS